MVPCCAFWLAVGIKLSPPDATGALGLLSCSAKLTSNPTAHKAIVFLPGLVLRMYRSWAVKQMNKQDWEEKFSVEKRPQERG